VSVVTPDRVRLTRAALGTALVFTAAGTVTGVWASRLPSIRDRIDATPGQLSLALLAMGVGSVIAMPVAGYACRWFGSRQVTLVTVAVGCAAFGVAGFAPSLSVLIGVMFVFGIAFGSWDVSMNVQGSAVDLRASHDWMPRYHACWSLGTVVGAASGALAARAGLSVQAHFTMAGVIAAVACLAGIAWYIEERGVRDPATVETGTAPRGRVVTGALLLIGLITLSATTIEGAAIDWLALYLADDRGASHASAALGFTVFATAMTVGRFAGTPINARLGRDVAVRIGGVLGVAGVLLTVLSPVLVGNYVGATLWGLGTCLVFPAAVSAAGETDRPAEAIGVVTTIGYGAILVGPPVIGGLADQIGLGRALLSLLVLGVTVAVLAPTVRSSRQGR
jgi:predicted MFS family arabinose efflux permease